MTAHNGLLFEEVSALVEDYQPVRGTDFEDESVNLYGVLTEVPPFPPSVEGHLLIISPWDILSKVHALPDYKDLGEIVEDTHVDVVIWNNTEVPVTLVGVTLTKVDDASFTYDTPPIYLPPETSVTFDLTVNFVGSPDHETLLTFEFSNGQTSVVRVIGTRPEPPVVPVPKLLYYEYEGKPTLKLLESDDIALEGRSNPCIHAVDDAAFEGVLLAELGRGPLEGEQYWNTTLKRYRYWNGTSWQTM